MVRLLDAVQTLDKASSPQQLTTRIVAATRCFGATSVSVNLIVTPLRLLKPGILLGHRWQEWSDRYGRERFASVDPAVRMLRSQNRSFTWAEALQTFSSPAAVRVLDACNETTGAAAGVVVPVRDSDDALLSAAFAGEQLDTDPEVLSAFHLAGYYFATRGRELLHGIELQPRCLLTPRQIDVLKLVLSGKSDADMALIMRISESTVHKHVEAAKATMNASKRAQAAHDAWRRGWLD